MNPYETITFEKPEEGIGVLTLDRPDRLNAISHAMIEELHDCLSALESDYGTRVLIFTGAGRGFCSGTDLKASSQANADADADPDAGADASGVSVQGTYRGQRRLADLAIHMRKIPQPIIGAINGVAAGGGFSFSMMADIRVADPSARFIVSFINVGLSAGDVGSSYFLPRLIGLSRASELMYTGRPMDAAEAERTGYVSQISAEGGVMDTAMELARTMLTKSPFGLRMTKELLNHSIDAPSLEAALYMENRTQSLAVGTGDFRIAIEAFKEKKPPVYPSEVV